MKQLQSVLVSFLNWRGTSRKCLISSDWLEMWEAIPQLPYGWNGMLLHLLSFTCISSHNVTFSGSQRSRISSYNTFYITIYNSDVFYTKVPYLNSNQIRFSAHSTSNQELSTHSQSKIIPVTKIQIQMQAYMYIYVHIFTFHFVDYNT